MKKIIHDYDGCLVNYLEGFGAYLTDFHNLEVDPQGPKDYDLSKWVGLDREKVLNLILTFNSNQGGFFERLPAMPGAIEAVSLFREAGLVQEVVTACHDADSTKAARLLNAERHFGGFDGFEFVSMTGSKEVNFSRRDPSFLIEDNLKNALLGARLGHEVFLIDTPYNQCEKDIPVTRVTGWNQITDVI
ncbi:unnamed protein product, partial [Laminaria digitata]